MDLQTEADYEHYKALVRRARLIRKDQRGLSQTELAEALGVGQPVIAKMENFHSPQPRILSEVLIFLTANHLVLDRMELRYPVLKVGDQKWEEFLHRCEARREDGVRKIETAGVRASAEAEQEDEDEPEDGDQDEDDGATPAAFRASPLRGDRGAVT